MISLKHPRFLSKHEVLIGAIYAQFISLFLMCSICCADTLPKVISRSHDGQYEIQPVNIDPAGLGSFNIAVFDTKTGTKIHIFPATYDIAHGCEWITLWHPRLPIVAIDVPDARRAGHIEIFRFLQGKPDQLTIPDYLQNALGRVKATETFNTGFSKLIAWNKDDLKLDLSFNAFKENTRDFQGFYLCIVTLRIHPLDNIVELVSITDPKDQ